VTARQDLVLCLTASTMDVPAVASAARDGMHTDRM
jgi:hypothetical protein